MLVSCHGFTYPKSHSNVHVAGKSCNVADNRLSAAVDFSVKQYSLRQDGQSIGLTHTHTVLGDDYVNTATLQSPHCRHDEL